MATWKRLPAVVLRFSTYALLCASLSRASTGGEPDFGMPRFRLGSGTANNEETVELALTLSTTVPVQGLVAVFEWDGSRGTGVDLVPAPAIAGADSLQVRVEDDFMVLGVVVDNDGTGENTIPVGDDMLLATATIRCSAAGETAVGFADGKHAATDGGPLLDNIGVIEGLSVGVKEGLELAAGSFTCREQGVPVRRLALGDDESVSGSDVELPLTLSSSDPVQGLVAVFEWDGGSGTGIDLIAAPALSGADTVERRIADDHMVLGVVVDNNGTGDNSIPAGSDILLATAVIRCDAVGQTDVRFVDGVHSLTDGGPLLDNIVVIEGLSVGVGEGLELGDGSFVCRAGGDAIAVAFDIKPGSCPNPLNVRSQGVTPAAILGTEIFDVRAIDPASLRLEGLAPLRWSLEDVGTPFAGEAEEGDCTSCAATGLDGIPDLTLKFDTPALVAALGEVSDEECRVLVLTGNLREDAGGNDIVGTDVIRILDRGNGHDPDHRGDTDGEGDGNDERPPHGRPAWVSRRALVADVNGDGIVDVRDPLAILAQSLGGQELAIPRDADADGDGGVDPRDALLVLSAMLLGH